MRATPRSNHCYHNTNHLALFVVNVRLQHRANLMLTAGAGAAAIAAANQQHKSCSWQEHLYPAVLPYN
jgi:hypothetical protein